jgi:peptide/nickel transport system ATP-binding protein/oligopeptide transport system ATP-binding protein
MSTDSSPTPVLSVNDLVVHFHRREGLFIQREVGTIHAVCGVTFDLAQGETLGLVGESGCGKTTTGRAILQLIKPTAGTVQFDGSEITTLSPKDMREVRRSLQVVFQDPYGSLDPRMPVGELIGEPLVVHSEWDKKSGIERVSEAMKTVGLDPRFINRYPNEFSGGQRQRIGIARALIMNPKVLILDEPVSALDVSIQAGVVDLLEDLQEKLGLSYLFIAHDLSPWCVTSRSASRSCTWDVLRRSPIATLSTPPPAPLHPGPAVSVADS